MVNKIQTILDLFNTMKSWRMYALGKGKYDNGKWECYVDDRKSDVNINSSLEFWIKIPVGRPVSYNDLEKLRDVRNHEDSRRFGDESTPIQHRSDDRSALR